MAIVSLGYARFASLVLAMLGGLALACAAPPLGLWPAVFVAFGLLVGSLDLYLREDRSALSLALPGLTFGFAVHAVALFTLGDTFVRFGHLPWALAWLVAAATWLLQSLPYALATLLAGWLAPART